MTTALTTIKMTAGRTKTISRQTPQDSGSFTGPFTGTETITLTAWPADSETAAFSVSGIPNASWTNAATNSWQVTIVDSVTIGIAPGIYSAEVKAALAGTETVPLFVGFLEIGAASGAVSPLIPDLISAYYCFGILSELKLTAGQQQAVPALISAASASIRKTCTRHFTLNTWIEYPEVSLNGQIRLMQVPVQQVTRLQGPEDQAMWVSNNSTSVQISQAYFTYSGEYSDALPVTPTGIYLNWISSGVPSNATVLYAGNATLSALASAINAVGNGWSATVNTGYSNWPSTELINGFLAQGASQNNLPNSRAIFNVKLDMALPSYVNPYKPIITIGRVNNYSNGARWGPGGTSLWNDQRTQLGNCKVTYVAGQTNVQADVQRCTAMLVKWYLEQGNQELMIASEQAGEYSYDLAEDMIHKMPATIREELFMYKQYFA